MKLKEALPEIFRRPVPVVAKGTSILVAGTLLDTPQEMLKATLEDVESVESIEVHSSTTLKDASELFKPVSGA